MCTLELPWVSILSGWCDGIMVCFFFLRFLIFTFNCVYIRVYLPVGLGMCACLKPEEGVGDCLGSYCYLISFSFLSV